MLREKPQILNMSRAIPPNWQDIGAICREKPLGAWASKHRLHGLCAASPIRSAGNAVHQTIRLANGLVYHTVVQTSKTGEPKGWMLG